MDFEMKADIVALPFLSIFKRQNDFEITANQKPYFSF